MKIKDMREYLKNNYKESKLQLKSDLEITVVNKISIEDKLEIIENVIEAFYDIDLGIFDKYTFEIFKPYIMAKFYIKDFKIPTITIDDDKQEDYKSIYDMFYNTDIYEKVYDIIKQDFEILLNLIEERYIYLEKKHEKNLNISRNIGKLLNKFSNLNPEDLEKYEKTMEKFKNDKFVKELININNK